MIVCNNVASAQLIAYEPFNYPPGSLAGGTATTAVGFAGPWERAFPNVADLASVGGGSLSYSGLFTSANQLNNGHNIIGESLDTSVGGPFAAYRDANGNIGLDGTTLYMSVLINESGSNLAFSAFSIFRDSTNDADRRASIDVWTGHPGGDNLHYYVSSWQPTNSLVSAAQLNSFNNATHLFVLKFLFGAGNIDTLTVYADPAANGSEPVSPTGVITGTDLSFDRVATAHFATGVISADEIRVGGNYASVVPEPSTLGLGLVAFTAVLLRRRGRIA